jgi:hypothetical protein
MLKAALTPHVDDYKLTVHYGAGDNDFEMIASSDTSIAETVVDAASIKDKKPISLFDTSISESEPPSKDPAARFDAVPAVEVPAIIQAPHKIPALFPFVRTTAYLLLSPSEHASNPEKLTLRGTSPSGPLEITIPIQKLSSPSETLHQLAAKKAVHELEQGRGWLYDVKTTNGKTLKEANEGNWDLMVERECVRLGTQFQVAGKFTSFVAVERKLSAKASNSASDDETHEEVIPGRSRAGMSPVAASSFGGSFFIDGAAPKQIPAYQMASPGGLFGAAAPRSASRSSSLFALSAGGMPSPPPPAPSGALHASYMPNAPANQVSFGAPTSPIGRQNQGRRARGGFLAGGLFGFSSSQAPDRERKTLKKKGRAHGTIDSYRKEMDSAAAMPLADEDDDEAEGYGEASPDGLSLEQLAALPDDAKMHKLIEMQRFNGAWSASEALWKVLVVFEASVRAKVLGTGAQGDVAADVLATVAAVAWLKAKMKGEEEVWEMVVEKAETWLEDNGAKQEWIVEIMALF